MNRRNRYPQLHETLLQQPWPTRPQRRYEENSANRSSGQSRENCDVDVLRPRTETGSFPRIERDSLSFLLHRCGPWSGFLGHLCISIDKVLFGIDNRSVCKSSMIELSKRRWRSVQFDFGVFRFFERSFLMTLCCFFLSILAL